MRKHLLSLFITIGFGLVTIPTASAHHAFAAEYDVKKPVTLQGRLTKMEWTNPHGWLYLDVKDENGKVVNWAVEFGAPAALLKRGFRRTDFPEGEEIIVKGYRAKNGSSTINGASVTFADGRKLFTGGSAPEVPDEK